MSSIGFSQDDCGDTDNAKARKAYNKSQGKGLKKGEKGQLLLEALSLDEDYVNANWAVAEIMIRKARAKMLPPYDAQPYLMKVVALCPEHHSDTYYYLGELAYGKSEYKEAAEYYQKFLDFEVDNDAAYGRDYEQHRTQAKDQLRLAEFYDEQFSNPKPYHPNQVTPLSTDKQDEYLPLVTPDNEFMYFTRRWAVHTNGRDTYIQSDQLGYVERFSVSAIDRAGEIEQGDAMPAPFNMNESYNYGGATVTIDNKEMYLTICKPYQGSMNCDIFHSDYVYGKIPEEKIDSNYWKTDWHWTEPVALPEAVNGLETWESQPSISKDGNMLIFTSLRPGSKGADLYYSEKMADGSWSNAQNMGEVINTVGHEKTPFFHSDSRTLYFSSQGHLNHGGFDVFFSKRNDDGTWTVPQNIGYPINSESDDHGFVVSTDGKKVYFSSKLLEGTQKINVYSFELYPEARPEKVVVLKGRVLNKSGEPAKNAKVEVKNTLTEQTESFDVDEVNGNYTAIVTVKEEEELVVSIDAEDGAFQSYLIETDTLDTYAKLSSTVKEVEVGGNYTLNNITYATNSADLDEKSYLVLKEFAEYLKNNSSMAVSIEGHTDNVGNDHANLTLSTERAFEVMAYLQSMGIEKERLKYKGWGSAKPIASNSTPKGRSQNRRTEFVILEL